MAKTNDAPVIIVGAGPVGLALAGDLGWRGVPSIVVEQTDGSIYQPRQDLVGIRTMEFCRRWGIVQDVIDCPYPRDYPQDNIYMAGPLVGGWEIGRYEVKPMGEDKPPQQSPQIRERCPQNMFDPILGKFAKSFECVTMMYRHRFASQAQDEQGVSVVIEDLEKGGTKTLRARYLVACDGASSSVRRDLDITMLGNPALTYTTNVIFRCDGFEKVHGRKIGYRFIFIGTEGTWATIVAINGRDQWRFSIIQSGDGSRALSENEVRAAIRKAVGADFEYEILSTVPWTRRELVADRYRRGNIFVAGDAAHANSPTGGFGMNTGVGDSVDLSWKIAAVLEGWGGPGLLDSYSAERQPVAARNVREASVNLDRMLSPNPDPHLLDDTADGAARRQKTGQDFAEAISHEWRTLGIHLGYIYEGSPICVADGSPMPSREPSVYEQTSRPGSRAPHVWLKDGTSTLDYFGRGFVLMRLGADAPDVSAFQQAATAAGVPLTVVNNVEPDVVTAYERKLVLVRPDGHSAWRGDGVPDDPQAIIDCVRGA
jgi:2-polyprenyl-6-methoxyphenol hydroxylase-like FAD-dependent oxidoreductase